MVNQTEPLTNQSSGSKVTTCTDFLPASGIDGLILSSFFYPIGEAFSSELPTPALVQETSSPAIVSNVVASVDKGLNKTHHTDSCYDTTKHKVEICLKKIELAKSDPEVGFPCPEHLQESGLNNADVSESDELFCDEDQDICSQSQGKSTSEKVAVSSKSSKSLSNWLYIVTSHFRMANLW